MVLTLLRAHEYLCRICMNNSLAAGAYVNPNMPVCCCALHPVRPEPLLAYERLFGTKTNADRVASPRGGSL